MFLLMYTFLMLTMIILMMTLILNLTSKKMIHEREKSSPFECGFDPKSSARMPFSIHFFLIAIIFLIFDVELTLLFPMIMSLKMTNLSLYMLTVSLFIMILMVGLYHEWSQGALNWTI